MTSPLAELQQRLDAALAEAAALAADGRGWQLPDAATLAEARALLPLLGAWPAPVVEVEHDGAIALSWDALGRGWLKLVTRGQGQLAHEGVIDGDDYEQLEPFTGAELPDWAHELLRRLWPCDA